MTSLRQHLSFSSKQRSHSRSRARFVPWVLCILSVSFSAQSHTIACKDIHLDQKTFSFYDDEREATYVLRFQKKAKDVSIINLENLAKTSMDVYTVDIKSTEHARKDLNFQTALVYQEQDHHFCLLSLVDDDFLLNPEEGMIETLVLHSQNEAGDIYTANDDIEEGQEPHIEGVFKLETPNLSCQGHK